VDRSAGPGAGTQRPLGVIILGDNCLAIDIVIARLVGLRPEQVPTNRAAFRKGLKPSIMDEIEILCDSIEQHKVKDFIFPRPVNVTWNIPALFYQKLKRYLVILPRVDKDKCSLCRLCEEACPAGAMSHVNGKMKVNCNTCISCFCCQENCPQGAITSKQGWLIRLLG